MPDGVQILTAIVAVAVVVAAVGIRTFSRGRTEIKLTDAVISVIAAALVLMVAGRINLDLTPEGGLKVEATKQAILSAAEKPVGQQVSALPVGPIDVALKGGVSEIPSLLRKQVQGLEFVLGSDEYDPEAVRQFLGSLTQHSFFRYVIILEPNRNLFGMFDARGLLAYLLSSDAGFQNFTMLLNRGTASERAQLKQIPGFVPASAAVTRQTDKRDVLAKMESLGTEWLPVTTGGTLDGIVDRSRVTASLILDIANQLKASAPAQK